MVRRLFCTPPHEPDLTPSTEPLAFQDLILTLQNYWGAQGCAILQPYDMEVGAGTLHPATPATDAVSASGVTGGNGGNHNSIKHIGIQAHPTPDVWA